VVLVAVTGYGRDEELHRCQSAGFHCHLLKPVGLESLQELLASAETVTAGLDEGDRKRFE
jgi:two-component system CheB/CheR fusion protein